jgi:hypothetical protein
MCRGRGNDRDRIINCTALQEALEDGGRRVKGKGKATEGVSKVREAAMVVGVWETGSHQDSRRDGEDPHKSRRMRLDRASVEHFLAPFRKAAGRLPKAVPLGFVVEVMNTSLLKRSKIEDGDLAGRPRGKINGDELGAGHGYPIAPFEIGTRACCHMSAYGNVLEAMSATFRGEPAGRKFGATAGLVLAKHAVESGVGLIEDVHRRREEKRREEN